MDQTFLELEERKVTRDNTHHVNSKTKLGNIKLKKFSGTWTADGTNVLVNVNLEAHSGQLIAIVGPVGSGKVKFNEPPKKAYVCHQFEKYSFIF